MKKYHVLIAIMSMLAAGLSATNQSFGAASNITDYGWNILMDNADFYWSFNENGATDPARDAARDQANDQLIPLSGASRAASLTANLGQAASFDGVDSVFQAAAMGDSILSGAYAVEFWVQMNDYAGTQGTYIANFMGTGGGDCPGIVYGYTTDTLEIYGGGGRTGDSGATVTDAGWHHVVLANYGNGVDIGVANRADLIIDGTVTTVLGSNTQPQMNVNGALNVGRWTDWGGTDFNGKIDELAIYDLSGMSEAQIAAKLGDISGHRNLINSAAAPTLAMVDPAEVSYCITPCLVPVHETIYGDSTGDELADGVVASTIHDLSDTSSMAFYDPVAENPDYGEAIFDLGSVKNLAAVWVDYLAGDDKWGVNAPESLELSFSEDGVSFSTPIIVDDLNNENYGGAYFHSRRSISELSDVDARYVKLGVVKDGTFAFLSEVSFIENTGAVPEPSTIVLLVGMIAAFGFIRRKR